MRIGLIWVVTLGLTLGVSGAVQAQTLRNSSGPAEVPSASYKGQTYIDSRGCVYIRAGRSGTTQWVPRVNRDRSLVCGQRPTVQAAAPRKVVDPLPKIAPTPAPRVAAAPQQAVRKAAPVVRQAKPVVRQPVRVVRRQAATSGVVHHFSTPGGTLSQSQARPGVRVVRQGQPRKNFVAEFINPTVPNSAAPVAAPRPVAGYRSVWDDGRLNPQRGVTRYYAAGGPVSRSGVIHHFSEPANVRGGVLSTKSVTPKVQYRGLTQTVQAVKPAPTPQPNVRARAVVVPAAARAAPRQVSGSHRFVQVGSFGVASNASRLSQQLQQSGLPVTTRRSGGLQVVMVGPMSDRATLGSALAQVRSLGFTDAFTRR